MVIHFSRFNLFLCRSNRTIYLANNNHRQCGKVRSRPRNAMTLFGMFHSFFIRRAKENFALARIAELHIRLLRIVQVLPEFWTLETELDIAVDDNRVCFHVFTSIRVFHQVVFAAQHDAGRGFGEGNVHFAAVFKLQRYGGVALHHRLHRAAG